MYTRYNEYNTCDIFDGEVLNYKCNACNHKFGRIIGYGCCCPNEGMRKKILEEHPTTCPECNSRSVERIRRAKYARFRDIAMGRKLHEWEN